MLEFRIDPRSGVPAYLQLVQQVKHALRVGILEPGDQLPTVKSVAGQLAVNANTVLRAYRDLESEGLVQARPGLGTFVLRALAGPSPAAHAALQRRLDRWVRQAVAAGLDTEGIEGLFRNSMHSVLREGVA